MNSNIVKNRSEIVFLYDIKDANPNGDPLAENKPRVDPEVGINLVTDVRLKRTIRDYLKNNKEEEILIREIRVDDGTLQDAKLRAEDFLTVDKKELKSILEMHQHIDEAILTQCIDARLFGATLPFQFTKDNKSTITHTGPVQFGMGRSLHRIATTHIKGTGAFASQSTAFSAAGKGSKQKTFREEDVVFYSLIGFQGIINENLARETHLREDDIELLMDSLWNGTKNLTSRTKVGQIPRLLIQVTYRGRNYHLGELIKYIQLKIKVPEEQIRDPTDYELDLTALHRVLKDHAAKIETIRWDVNRRVEIVPIQLNGSATADLDSIFKDVAPTATRFGFGE